MKARSAETKYKAPANEQDVHDKAADLWRITGRKALIDIFDLRDNDFKQKVISYANNKYGKAKP
jgi:muconolactone delta-isomerase